MGYNDSVKLRWSEEKAEWLKKERDIDVYYLEDLFERGEFLDSFKHPNRSHQTVYVFNENNYALVSICVEDFENKGGLFLKTAYFSREYTKFYLR